MIQPGAAPLIWVSRATTTAHAARWQVTSTAPRRMARSLASLNDCSPQASQAKPVGISESMPKK
jgi:hypothetical protein